MEILSRLEIFSRTIIGPTMSSENYDSLQTFISQEPEPFLRYLLDNLPESILPLLAIAMLAAILLDLFAKRNCASTATAKTPKD